MDEILNDAIVSKLGKYLELDVPEAFKRAGYLQLVDQDPGGEHLGLGDLVGKEKELPTTRKQLAPEPACCHD